MSDFVIQLGRNQNCATERQLKANLLHHIAHLFTRVQRFYGEQLPDDSFSGNAL